MSLPLPPAINGEAAETTLAPDRLDEAESALARRNGFRTASIVSFAGAAALAVTGGLLFYFDLPGAGR